MIENNIDNVKNRIKDITLKIDLHENKISMHSSAIKKLRNERDILIKKIKSELLPCPFCGSAGYVKKNPFTGHYSVECKKCGAKMTGEMISSAKAIEEWNRRNNHGKE